MRGREALARAGADSRLRCVARAHHSALARGEETSDSRTTHLQPPGDLRLRRHCWRDLRRSYGPGRGWVGPCDDRGPGRLASPGTRYAEGTAPRTRTPRRARRRPCSTCGHHLDPDPACSGASGVRARDQGTASSARARRARSSRGCEPSRCNRDRRLVWSCSGPRDPVAAVARPGTFDAFRWDLGGDEYRRALLIGLNLGPNLAVTGSLSAVVWFRAARSVDADASWRTYTRIGLAVAAGGCRRACRASCRQCRQALTKRIFRTRAR